MQRPNVVCEGLLSLRLGALSVSYSLPLLGSYLLQVARYILYVADVLGAYVSRVELDLPHVLTCSCLLLFIVLLVALAHLVQKAGCSMLLAVYSITVGSYPHCLETWEKFR